MPLPRLTRQKRVALAVGTTGLVAAAGTAAYLLLREHPKGKLVCPASPVVGPNDLREGDFVVLELAALDRSVTEPTWARVLGPAWLGLGSSVKVRIDAEFVEGSDPVVLKTEKHGYAFGDVLRVDHTCVWDRYRPLSGRATLVCGPLLAKIPYDAGVPDRPDPRAEALRLGDAAAVVVAVGGRPVEIVWLRLVDSSVASQVLLGEIEFDTEFSDLHGLLRGAQIEFIRDCVVDTDIGGI